MRLPLDNPSSDETQHLCQLLIKLDSTAVATSNYVQSGTAYSAHLDSELLILPRKET